MLYNYNNFNPRPSNTMDLLGELYAEGKVDTYSAYGSDWLATLIDREILPQLEIISRENAADLEQQFKLDVPDSVDALNKLFALTAQDPNHKEA